MQTTVAKHLQKVRNVERKGSTTAARNYLPATAKREHSDDVDVLLPTASTSTSTHADPTKQTQLRLAVLLGDAGTVVSLLEEGADPTQCNNRGVNAISCTALVDVAVMYGVMYQTKRVYLERWKDVWDAKGEAFPALCVAALRGRITNALFLLTCGCAVNTWNVDQLTPMHCAIWVPHPNMVSLLLRYGADPFQAFVIALSLPIPVYESNTMVVVKRIFTYLRKRRGFTKIDTVTRDIARFAAMYDREGGAVNLLLEQFPRVLHVPLDDAGWRMLEFAASCDNYCAVDILLYRKGARPGRMASGLTTLGVAAKYNATRVVRRLVEYIQKYKVVAYDPALLVTPGQDDVSPLYFAALYKNRDMYGILLHASTTPYLAFQVDEALVQRAAAQLGRKGPPQVPPSLCMHKPVKHNNDAAAKEGYLKFAVFDLYEKRVKEITGQGNGDPKRKEK